MLKLHSDILTHAGAVKELLAWSPSLGLAGESNAIHAAFSVYQSDWVSLAESSASVDKATYYTLATQARVYAENDAHIGQSESKEMLEGYG